MQTRRLVCANVYSFYTRLRGFCWVLCDLAKVRTNVAVWSIKASNIHSASNSVEMTVDKIAPIVQEIERQIPTELKPPYSWLLQILNNTIPDGEQFHETIVGLIHRTVKVCQKCNEPAKIHLVEKINTEWPFLTAIFDSPDVAGFGKIIALPKSNHDLLHIFIDHIDSQKTNANNPFKVISSRTRKS